MGMHTNAISMESEFKDNGITVTPIDQYIKRNHDREAAAIMPFGGHGIVIDMKQIEVNGKNKVNHEISKLDSLIEEEIETTSSQKKFRSRFVNDYLCLGRNIIKHIKHECDDVVCIVDEHEVEVVEDNRKENLFESY